MDWRPKADSEALVNESPMKTNRTLIGGPERSLKHFRIRIFIGNQESEFEEMSSGDCPSQWHRLRTYLVNLRITSCLTNSVDKLTSFYGTDVPTPLITLLKSWHVFGHCFTHASDRFRHHGIYFGVDIQCCCRCIKTKEKLRERHPGMTLAS